MNLKRLVFYVYMGKCGIAKKKRFQRNLDAQKAVKSRSSEHLAKLII